MSIDSEWKWFSSENGKFDDEKKRRKRGLAEILVWPGRDRIWWVSREIGLRYE